MTPARAAGRNVAGGNDGCSRPGGEGTNEVIMDTVGEHPVELLDPLQCIPPPGDRRRPCHGRLGPTLRVQRTRCAHALATAVARCRKDDAVDAVILSGAGQAFCAGDGMKAAAAHVAAGGDPRQFSLDLTVPLHRVVTDLRP